MDPVAESFLDESFSVSGPKPDANHTDPAAAKFLQESGFEPLVAPGGGVAGDVPAPEKNEGFLASVKKFVMGDNEFDYPEPPPSLLGVRQVQPDGTRSGPNLGFGLTLEPSGDGKFNIFKKHFPDATKGKDKNGNVFAVMGDGRRFYMNRSGASSADIDEVMSDLAMGILFGAGGAKLGGRVGGNAGRIAGGTTGGAAESVVKQTLSDLAGSEQGLDLFNVMVTALFGGAGESVGLGFDAVSNILKNVFSKGGYDPKTGAISEEAANLLKSIDVDVDQITPAIAERLHKLSNLVDDVPVEGINRAAQAEALPVPVPLTRGDVTRNADDQMFESDAAKGMFGEVPRDTLKSSNAAKDQALKENADIMQGNLSGGGMQVDVAGDGAAAVQKRLVSVKDGIKVLEDEAFALARGSDAAINTKFATMVVKPRLTAALDARDLDLDAMPAVRQSLKFFDKKVGTGDAVSIGDMERWRRNAVQIEKAQSKSMDGAGPQSAMAMREMINTYDGTMLDLVNRGLVEGDPAVVGNWVKARMTTERMREIFNSKDIIEQLTEATNSGRLAVGADDAVDIIFGRGKLGATKGLEAQLKALKDVLIQNGGKAEWDALREEGFLRLLRTQGKGNNRGADGKRIFSGDKFATALDDAVADSRGAMRVLFEPEELKAFQQLRDVALSATNTVEGGKNFSNSGASVAGLIRGIIGNGKLGQASTAIIERILEPFNVVAKRTKARDAVSGVRPKAKTTIGFGASIGTATSPDQDD